MPWPAAGLPRTHRHPTHRPADSTTKGHTVKDIDRAILIKPGSFGPWKYQVVYKPERWRVSASSLQAAYKKAEAKRKELAQVKVERFEVHASDANARVDIRR